MDDLGVSLGRHAEAIDNLKSEVGLLRADVGEIKELLAAGKGGWKSIVWVGTIATTLGGFAAGMMQWLTSHS